MSNTKFVLTFTEMEFGPALAALLKAGIHPAVHLNGETNTDDVAPARRRGRRGADNSKQKEMIVSQLRGGTKRYAELQKVLKAAGFSDNQFLYAKKALEKAGTVIKTNDGYKLGKVNGSGG